MGSVAATRGEGRDAKRVVRARVWAYIFARFEENGRRVGSGDGDERKEETALTDELEKKTGRELSEEGLDEALFRKYLDELSGEAARRRAIESVLESEREREDYWRRAHERGEIVPRDYEDRPWYR